MRCTSEIFSSLQPFSPAEWVKRVSLRFEEEERVTGELEGSRCGWTVMSGGPQWKDFQRLL